MTMRVRMLQTANGAPEPGTHTYEYADGKVYDVDDDLGRVFVEFGYAELDTGNEDDKNVKEPKGSPIPETEDERRDREAAELAGNTPTPPQDISIVDPDHYPAQADAIAQARTEVDAQGQGAAAPEADAEVDLTKLSRKDLDEAAKQIGLDTLKLPNKDAVRDAIRDAQGL